VTVSSTISPTLDEPTSEEPERLSLFQRVADRVSYGMGSPTNIAVWIVLVVGWVLLFALDHNPHISNGSFMPKWFTSTGFNFPLNLVTTVAELYIGFLVGASSNRSERNLEATLASISHQNELIRAQEKQIQGVEEKLAKSLEQNTELTKIVHDLTQAIHASICGVPASPASPEPA
jgi:low affinity Fe/Cu permease